MAATLDAVRRAGRGEAVWQPAQLARIAQWRAAVQRPWTSLTERERALLLAVSHGESVKSRPTLYQRCAANVYQHAGRYRCGTLTTTIRIG